MFVCLFKIVYYLTGQKHWKEKKGNDITVDIAIFPSSIAGRAGWKGEDRLQKQLFLLLIFYLNI